MRSKIVQIFGGLYWKNHSFKEIEKEAEKTIKIIDSVATEKELEALICNESQGFISFNALQYKFILVREYKAEKEPSSIVLMINAHCLADGMASVYMLY